jgi:hypothetical protein
MCKLWPRKLLVKGILRSADAERCIEASGYRRGTDIVKALALGTNAVLLGARRSMAWRRLAVVFDVDRFYGLDELRVRIPQRGWAPRSGLGLASQGLLPAPA